MELKEGKLDKYTQLIAYEMSKGNSDLKPVNRGRPPLRRRWTIKNNATRIYSYLNIKEKRNIDKETHRIYEVSEMLKFLHPIYEKVTNNGGFLYMPP